mgnify:CR=1 FL=1
MDAIRNQIVERLVIEKITGAAKLNDQEDFSFLKSDEESSSISLAVAGDFDDIPEAKHDEGASPVPQAAKLPEAEKKDDE